MFNFRILAILKRELREKILSKTFILMTLLLPLFMFGLLAFQTFLITYENEENANLIIVSEIPGLVQNMQGDFAKLPLVKSGKYKISFETMARNKLETRLDEMKSDLLNEKLTGIVFIPESAKKDKKVEYYSKSPSNSDLTSKISGIINQSLVDNYFNDKQLSKEDIEYARQRVDFNGFRISADKEIKEERKRMCN